jgi:hypothetical protein
MLFRNQADISAQRAMPVENIDDSSKVITESGETVALSYYNAGVLTTDGGQAAGTLVVGKFAYNPILDGIGSKVANKDNTSLSFTCLAFTNAKPFPYEKLEQSFDTTGTVLLQNICAGFSNGDYTVDYRTGTIYGKKATTATSMTSVSYKRPSSTATVDVGDIEIGAVEIKDGSSDQRASVNSNGELKVTGSPTTIADYKSPTDFTVTYTSASTVTLTGLPFTITNGTQVSYIKVRNGSTNITTVYVNGAGGYAFAHSSGVITAYLNGVATSIFTVNDMYEMGVNGQQKSYDATLDVGKVINQSPDRASYVQDSLLDTTNIAAATNYYPSSLGMSMDGYKDASLSGKFIDADGTMTMSIEVTNDEDQTNADWIDASLSCGDVKTGINVIASALTVTNGTLTFGLSLENLNFSYFRVKMVNDGATNTGIIKLRRKSL